jgi:hypothetical protein
VVTKDEVIATAKDAGFEGVVLEMIAHTYELGVKAEREACWKIACEYTQLLQSHTCLKVADAIRARGEA